MCTLPKTVGSPTRFAWIVFYLKILHIYTQIRGCMLPDAVNALYTKSLRKENV